MIDAEMKSIINSANKELSKFKILSKIEAKTKIPKLYIVAFSFISLLIATMVLLRLDFIVNLALTLYPLHASFVVIESGESKGTEQWLAYWMIFGLATVLETSPIRIKSWVPFYSLLKLVYFVYLYLPHTQGATVVYRKFIRKFYLSRSAKVQAMVNKIKDSAQAQKRAARQEAAKSD